MKRKILLLSEPTVASLLAEAVSRLGLRKKPSVLRGGSGNLLEGDAGIATLPNGTLLVVL